MKTFKQFLSEEEKNELRDMIEKNCQPFLKESRREAFVYRGIKKLFTDAGPNVETVMSANSREIPYTIKSVREDRKPLDTQKHHHTILDDWFQENVGFKARTTAVFCFGEGASMTDIRHYGVPAIIFPIGPIKYAYAKYVEDLFMEIKNDFKKDELETLLDHAGYVTTGLPTAVTGNHEIMIQCQHYYAFPYSYKKELQEALDYDTSDF